MQTKMRDDTKTEPAELRINQPVGHIISPAVLNFKIFVKHVPRAWVPQECCLRLRNYAANVVWFISMSKDRKSPFRWKTVIPAAVSFGKRVFHHNRCVQKSQIQFEC